MGTYLKLILKHAFAKFFWVADSLSALTGLLIPSIQRVSGNAMQEDWTDFLAWAVVIAVGGGICLRLILSPYFIWKEDQAEIARLKALLDDPRKKQKEQLQSGFVLERASLIRSLVAIVTDIRKLNDVSDDSSIIINENYPSAAMFFIDFGFRNSWSSFEDNLRGWQSVKDHAKAAGEALTTEDQLRIMARAGFHSTMVTASALAMIDFLGMGETHKETFERESKSASDQFAELDFDFDRQTQADH